MKTFKTTLVVIMATFGLLASLTVSTSAVGLASALAKPNAGTPAGTLNLWNSPSAPYDAGQQIELQANFSGAPGVITLYKEGPAGVWTSLGSQPANSNGNAYFNYTLTSGSQRLYAETAGDLETEIDTLTGIDPGPSAPNDGTIAGTLNLWNSPSAPYDTGQQIELQANFSVASGVTITLYKEGPADVWTSLGSQPANSNGNAYFNYVLTSGAQRLYAETAGNLETEIDTLTGNDPVPQTGLLDAPTNSGKNWSAHFTPGVTGKATQLQIQRIYTKETDEVTGAPATPTVGPWVTIATANQNAAGDVTFPTLSSPYPYRVEHNYRALVGLYVSNTVKFGLGQVTPKVSGLSALYFNTNEGHAVDTRTSNFEGEFSMTADTKGLGCADVGVTDPTKRLTNSVMKGRGNYSWSFRRKSYTLKLGKSTDLCGMGASKKYALISNDYDKSLMRNSLAGYIGKKFTNLAWTPDSKPVDLYLNGKYLGNYLLIERIAIDPLRVNIPELKADDGKTACDGTKPAVGQRVNPTHPNNLDPCKTGGYILEWDFRKGADYNAYLGSDSGYVGVKDPENDYNREGVLTNAGISSQQKSYISGYLNTVDSNLRGSGFTSDTTGWKKYIDEASAVDYYIAMEYMKPVDGSMWASVYMYKQRDSLAGAGDGKLFFGPMWDFDLSSGSANRAGNVVSPSSFYLRNNLGVSAQQSSKTWFNRLNEDPDFRAAVQARWNVVKPTLGTSTFLDTQKAIIATSAAQTYSVFSHSYRISTYQVIKPTFNDDVSYLRSWASSRTSWLDSGSGF